MQTALFNTRKRSSEFSDNIEVYFLAWHLGITCAAAHGLGGRRDKMCTSTFNEFYQCWIHVIVIIRNIQNNNALPCEVFPKPPGQPIPMALFHDENHISPLNLLGRQRNHGIMI